MFHCLLGDINVASISFKQRIRQGHMVLGAWMCSPNPVFAELASSLQLDYIIVDMENLT